MRPLPSIVLLSACILAATVAILSFVGCSAATVDRNATACRVAFLADAATTVVGLERGAQEQNPVLGGKGASVGAVVVRMVAAHAVTEGMAALGRAKARRDAKRYPMAAAKAREAGLKSASTVYGVCAVSHGGAALWNGIQLAKSNSGDNAELVAIVDLSTGAVLPVRRVTRTISAPGAPPHRWRNWEVRALSSTEPPN